jgi:hypothetical protein
VIWGSSSVVPVASAMCNMAEKSANAPGVLIALAACANAEIDLRECQTSTKNVRSLMGKKQQKYPVPN